MVAGIGKALASGLTRSLGKGTGAAVVQSNKKIATKVANAKSVESLRQSTIIEAQKAKEKIAKKQGFKAALKEAKANKQKSFTYEGQRFLVSNY
jgi:hypothetical protein|tara:strand:- start:268 stop:549 length:282 start_codon:yes stop_codon:yes gene_type:complete